MALPLIPYCKAITFCTLLADSQVPYVSTFASPRALNNLAWDRTPLSRRAALGGANGKVYVYELAEKLVQPRDSEWTDMQRVLAGIKARR
jgi:dynein intermediate chain